MAVASAGWVICKSAPRFRQTTTPAPHHSFYRPDALPAAPSTVSKNWGQISHRWRITFYPVNDQTDKHSRVKTTEKFSFALEVLDGVSWILFGIPLKKGGFPPLGVQSLQQFKPSTEGSYFVSDGRRPPWWKLRLLSSYVSSENLRKTFDLNRPIYMQFNGKVYMYKFNVTERKKTFPKWSVRPRVRASLVKPIDQSSGPYSVNAGEQLIRCRRTGRSDNRSIPGS